MYLDKSTRWTIYTIIIVVVIGFGYWVALTQRPDRYTPRDAPESVLKQQEDDIEEEAKIEFPDDVEESEDVQNREAPPAQ